MIVNIPFPLLDSPLALRRKEDDIVREKHKLSMLSNLVRIKPKLTKLFSGRFINAVMTAHVSSIAEYRRVALGNNFTLGSGITKCASINSVWKHSF